MAHVRELIRDQVVATLDVSGTSYHHRVFASRTAPFIILPALNILTLDENVVVNFGSMGTTQIRELRLHIEGRAKSADMPDDALDDMADEIEEAILNSPELDALAWDLTLESTDTSYSRDGSNPVGMVDIVFAFQFQTDGNDPSSIVS